jgi:haloacetate dehalogenase
MPDLADLFPGYASEWINTKSGRIFARVGGKGPPLLLLHGFSETHVMWHRVAPRYALKIYHWTFLAQPYPLPETLIGGAPDFFLKQKMASQTKSRNLDAIDPRALEHYLAAFRDPSRVHAMCEDYRAGATADFEIDKADHDAGKKITIPMLALWGDTGIAQAAATPLDTWKMWATNVSGAPIDSGHFLTEEAPDATAKELKAFFTAA